MTLAPYRGESYINQSGGPKKVVDSLSGPNGES